MSSLLVIVMTYVAGWALPESQAMTLYETLEVYPEKLHRHGNEQSIINIVHNYQSF